MQLFRPWRHASRLLATPRPVSSTPRRAPTQFPVGQHQQRLYASAARDGDECDESEGIVIDVPNKPVYHSVTARRTTSTTSSREHAEAATYTAAKIDVVGGVEYHLHDDEFTSPTLASIAGDEKAIHNPATDVTDDTPWYQRAARSSNPHTDSGFGSSIIPDLPTQPPMQLAALVQYLVVDLRLSDVSIVDLRGRETIHGRNTIMLIASARSERHVGHSAEMLSGYLRRTFGVTNMMRVLNSEQSKSRTRVYERRFKKKLSRYAGDVTAYEQALNAGVARGPTWMIFDTQVGGIIVHLVTGEKRWQLDLEGLWSHEIPNYQKRTDEQSTPRTAGSKIDLMHAREEAKKEKKERKRNARKPAGRRLATSFDRPRPESPEYIFFDQVAHTRPGRQHITPGFHRVELRHEMHTSTAWSATSAAETDSSGVVTRTGGGEPNIYAPPLLGDPERQTLLIRADALQDKLRHLKPSSEDLFELQHLLTKLSVNGHYWFVRKLAAYAPNSMQFSMMKDDSRSLLIAAVTNNLIKRNLTPPLPPSSLVANPGGGWLPIHWRRRLEYLQVVHSIDCDAVPARELTMHLVRQRASGVPVTVDDVVLVLSALALSREFILPDKRKANSVALHNQREWDEVSTRRFAEITYLLRTVGREEEPNLLLNVRVLTTLYRACVQLDTDVMRLRHNPFPLSLGAATKPNLFSATNPRTALVDKIFIVKGVRAPPSFVMLQLSTLAAGRDFDMFWKRWRDLYFNGLQRETWMWEIVAALVARSGDVNQMNYFLTVQWDAMLSELEMNQLGEDADEKAERQYRALSLEIMKNGEMESEAETERRVKPVLTKALARSALVCVQLVDPLHVVFNEIEGPCREFLGMSEDDDIMETHVDEATADGASAAFGATVTEELEEGDQDAQYRRETDLEEEQESEEEFHA
ncbi:uncharacterized protein V1518DRAFT_371663 [Limtongia smithiae]|uniref:uncharacterized protein n=1 Tax=Limtongia smithiae TaxID=1125753 RepID=UPI0034CD4AE7